MALCIFNVSGAAEEGNAVFGEAAARCIQKQYLQHGSPSKNLNSSSDDTNSISSKNFGSEDFSPRHLKHIQGGSMPAGTASQSLNGGPSNISFYNTPSPMATQVHSSMSFSFSIFCCFGFTICTSMLHGNGMFLSLIHHGNTKA